MSNDPTQSPWGYPPGGPPPGGSQPDADAQSGYDPYAAQATPAGGGAYQPPEGAHQGGNVPPAMGQAYYPAYPGPMAPATSPWAIASLICSILSWLLFPIVGSLAGVIFGHLALHEIGQSAGRMGGRGLAIAGLIIGYANLAFVLCVGSVIVLGFLLLMPVPR